LNKQQINTLCDIVCDDIERLLDSFGLKYRKHGKLISLSCPIHGGDNPSALNIYPNGDEVRGYFRCNTHGCHNNYPKNIIGFTMGVLSAQEDKPVGYNGAIQYLCKVYKINPRDIKGSARKSNPIKKLSLLPQQNKWMTRDKFRQRLKIPAEFYIQRGISARVLDEYDVGIYNNRVVVPIYDNEYRYVSGYTARTLNPKCPKCNLYHPLAEPCPNKEDPVAIYRAAKWVHSKGLNTEHYLYNYWFARPHILSNGDVILVESVGNVLKLVQNGYKNVVGTFGAHLTSMQELLLNMAGALNVVLLMDNDPAGNLARENITRRLKRTFNLRSIALPQGYNDVAELSDESIKLLLRI